LSRVVGGAASSRVTVVTLDGQWLKLLQVEGTAPSPKITKLLACGVEGAGPEDIKRTFQEACATEGVEVRDVLVACATHLSTVRLFSLPATDPKEIRDIVELQAEKHTPYAKEEILTDFTVIERGRSGYSRVLLVIVHQDVIHRSVRLLEACGLSLDRVGCELEGLMNWFRAVKKSAGSPAASVTSLVVEVDGSTTTILLMHRGQPQFVRSLASGSEQLAQDLSQTAARLVGELQRSLDAIEAEGPAVKIQEVLLTGRIERLGELKERIASGLQVPVSLVAPWVGRELGPSARQTSERLPDVSFAGLVGLALAPSEIDLTPPATKLRHAFEARAKSLVVLSCQFVAAMILSSLMLIGRAHEQSRYAGQLRRLVGQHTAEVAEIEDALKQIEFVKERLRRRGLLLEAASTLAEFTTPEITWESLSFTEGEGVVLKGTSTALPKIYEFVAGLDGSALFGQVETKRVAKGKSGEHDVTDFDITCPFVNAKALP
jgi:Tfp pilus assembly PilM family ATPase